MNRARATLVVLLVIPAAFAWACGGADNTIDDGGVDSGGNDGTVGNDTGPGKDGSGNDGTTNDTGTNDTGTSDTGTTDGGTTTDSSTGDSGTTSFLCQKPSDCDASFCCGTIVFNGGTIPNCNLADASSACMTTCKSNVALSCNATDTVRSCATHAECADAGNGYTDCCNVPFGDASVEFCWSKFIASNINGATCL